MPMVTPTYYEVNPVLKASLSIQQSQFYPDLPVILYFITLIKSRIAAENLQWKKGIFKSCLIEYVKEQKNICDYVVNAYYF